MPKRLIQRELWKILRTGQPGSYQQGVAKKFLKPARSIDPLEQDFEAARRGNVLRGTL